MKTLFKDKTILELIQVIFDSIDDGAIIACKDGKFVLWNSAAEQMVGYGPTDLPPEKWPEYYGCFELDGVTPMRYTDLPLYQALNGMPVSRREILIRNEKNPDGKILTITAKPLFDERNILRGGVIIFNDLQQIRRHAKYLAEHYSQLEEEYQNLYKMAPIGLFRTSIKDGKFLRCNQFLAEILDIENSEALMNHRITEFYDQKLRKKLLNILKTEGEIRDFEIPMTTASGRDIWASVNVKIYSENNYLEGSLQDITARKNLEKELAEYRLNEIIKMSSINSEIRDRLIQS